MSLVEFKRNVTLKCGYDEAVDNTESDKCQLEFKNQAKMVNKLENDLVIANNIIELKMREIEQLLQELQSKRSEIIEKNEEIKNLKEKINLLF